MTTEDGYVLEMHRITGTNANPRPEGKQPILLMHGLLTSSIDWIITGPSKALGTSINVAQYLHFIFTDRFEANDGIQMALTTFSSS